jgi:hypothetical protein
MLRKQHHKSKIQIQLHNRFLFPKGSEKNLQSLLS